MTEASMSAPDEWTQERLEAWADRVCARSGETWAKEYWPLAYEAAAIARLAAKLMAERDVWEARAEQAWKQMDKSGNEALTANMRLLDAEAALEASRAESARLRHLLQWLHAMVLGECPSLLNEDSGGSADLAMEIDAVLADSPTTPATGERDALKGARPLPAVRPPRYEEMKHREPGRRMMPKPKPGAETR